MNLLRLCTKIYPQIRGSFFIFVYNKIMLRKIKLFFYDIYVYICIKICLCLLKKNKQEDKAKIEEIFDLRDEYEFKKYCLEI